MQLSCGKLLLLCQTQRCPEPGHGVQQHAPDQEHAACDGYHYEQVFLHDLLSASLRSRCTSLLSMIAAVTGSSHSADRAGSGMPIQRMPRSNPYLSASSLVAKRSILVIHLPL